MLMIVFGAGCLLLSVLFHAASLLHLSLPLLYALIVPTLFSGWYYSHYALANGNAASMHTQPTSAAPMSGFRLKYALTATPMASSANTICRSDKPNRMLS